MHRDATRRYRSAHPEKIRERKRHYRNALQAARKAWLESFGVKISMKEAPFAMRELKRMQKALDEQPGPPAELMLKT
jgi:hypothetical protein